MSTPPVLIESWLPIEAIGVESKRERGASSALPPLYFLHVWWARKPLITCRASILASVLPEWSSNFPISLKNKFPNKEIYNEWFLRICGILGDPVKGQKLIEYAKSKNIQLNFHPFGGAPRAFTVIPSNDDMEIFRELLIYTWGTDDINLLDPFSGGGSIPFEAVRYGFNTLANDLNPVAATILKATLDYPPMYGVSLVDEIKKWGNVWAKKTKGKLKEYFPKQGNENIFAYLWARTIKCPTSGKLIPLSPNWWLQMGDNPVAVKLVTRDGLKAPIFEIVQGVRAKSCNPDVGTISRGIARSPWTGETIDGEYIKAEAQAGRMGKILFAIAVKNKGKIEFRSPIEEDIRAYEDAENELEQRLGEWYRKGIIPSEEIGLSNYNRGHRLYGVSSWYEFFSKRQLLAMGTIQETLFELRSEMDKSLGEEKSKAIQTYLAIIADKCADYNNTYSTWERSRQIVKHIFVKHGYGMVWSFAEFDASTNLLPWAIDQITDAYNQISNLTSLPQKTFNINSQEGWQKKPTITNKPAQKLGHIPDNSIFNITVDPPYYDNVQYSELSDFFYVWLKRNLGHVFPEFFTDELTNKDDEAVANPARFEGMVKKKKDLAEQDYERKMAAAFREMYRVLRDDGVLTIMFTHKKVEAWDTLASAIIGSGFVIKASWPIHTESEHSLHQAKKNAASSTILLVCRKREPGVKDQTRVWWDDIKEAVRQTARQKAEEFSQQGIHGVDLYLSTFGPTLSILSEHWPILTSEVDAKTGQPKPLRPETALNLAREEVVRLRKQGLLLGREVAFDSATDWYLMTWDAFKAEQFPYDEARKLAMALGIEMDTLIITQKRLASKKGGFVSLQTPAARRKKNMVDDEIITFPAWIDAAHTAMMVYSEDGPGACDAFLQRSGLKRDGTFKALLQALINAIPRNRIKGKFVRPEAETLENMRLAFFNDLQAPVEEEPELPAVQMGLWKEEEGAGEDENDEEEGEE